MSEHSNIFIHVMLRLISENLDALDSYEYDALITFDCYYLSSRYHEICIQLIFDLFLFISVDVAFHHFAKEKVKPQRLTDLKSASKKDTSSEISFAYRHHKLAVVATYYEHYLAVSVFGLLLTPVTHMV